MKIAVASQNRREITSHTGRCRKFWIYTVENKAVVDKVLLELPKEQCFHDSSPLAPSPLDDVQALIAGGMGTGLARRLEAKKIQILVTDIKDPDQAVNDFLNDSLKTLPLEPHEHGQRQRH